MFTYFAMFAKSSPVAPAPFTQCAVARCMAWQLRICLLPLMAAAPTAAARVSARCQRASSMRCVVHRMAWQLCIRLLPLMAASFWAANCEREGRKEGRTCPSQAGRRANLLILRRSTFDAACREDRPSARQSGRTRLQRWTLHAVCV